MDYGTRRAGRLLAEAKSVLCLTGAGVSAESGVPTFRDAQSGLYANMDPMDLASVAGFRKDPGLVWRWYMARFGQLATVEPNPGHRALAELESRVSAFTLVTQNVDDLHERAGSIDVVHLHGSIARYRCFDCEMPHSLSIEEMAAQEPPNCPNCGDLIRPDVVWFGEDLPGAQLARARQLAMEAQVLLVVGTSGQVFPAAEIPYWAKTHGATVIDVNVEASPISRMADLFLRGPSGEILPSVVEAVDLFLPGEDYDADE